MELAVALSGIDSLVDQGFLPGFDAGAHFFRRMRVADGHDVKAAAAGPLQGLRRGPGNPDRRVGFLYRARVKRDFAELPGGTLMTEALVSPRLQNHFESFV